MGPDGSFVHYGMIKMGHGAVAEPEVLYLGAVELVQKPLEVPDPTGLTPVELNEHLLEQVAVELQFLEGDLHDSAPNLDRYAPLVPDWVRGPDDLELA